MANSTMDFSGITLEFDQQSFINAVLPQIITALSTNPTLLKQLTAAVSTKQLQKARTTGNVNGRYSGSTQTAAASKINTNAIAR